MGEREAALWHVIEAQAKAISMLQGIVKAQDEARRRVDEQFSPRLSAEDAMRLVTRGDG